MGYLIDTVECDNTHAQFGEVLAGLLQQREDDRGVDRALSHCHEVREDELGVPPAVELVVRIPIKLVFREEV